MNVKALNKTGKGSMTWAIDGIIWAVDNGANVINLSLGSEFSALSLQRAVDYAWSKGVIVVAAAGNDSIYNALNICT
jgi:thermitase